MTSTPETPDHDGSDLAALRDEIDELQAIPSEELVSPVPPLVEEEVPAATPTDAIGSEKWDESASEESLEQD